MSTTDEQNNKSPVTLGNVSCSLSTCVTLRSIFRFNVNSEFTFHEQWMMKETSQDSTLDFF